MCGIVASTALMIAMATMVTSFRGAVDDWLGQVLSADLYMRTNAGASFDPATRARLAATPGVARMAFGRQLALTIAPDRPPICSYRPSAAPRGGSAVRADRPRGRGTDGHHA